MRLRFSVAIMLGMLAGCVSPMTIAPSDGGVDMASDPHRVVPPTPCGEPATLPTGVIFDSGDTAQHGSDRAEVARTRNRIVVRSQTLQRWTLWDATTATQIASGHYLGPGPLYQGDAPASWFSSDVFIVPAWTSTSWNVEVRSVDDGRLIGSIYAPNAVGYGLASDGSYVWSVSSSADGDNITVWSPIGTQLFTHAGNYRLDGRVVGAPSELRIAGGPAGANVVEYFAVPSAAESVSPAFRGTFVAWFVDGNRFLASDGGITLVYGKDASQQAIMDYANGGIGDYVWKNDPNGGVEFFTVGSMTPIYTAPNTYIDAGNGAWAASSTSIFVASYSDAQLFHLDSSGVTMITVPVPFPANVAAVDDAGDWVALPGDTIPAYAQGNSLDDDAHLFLGCGEIQALAGGGQLVAVATGDGNIHVVDANTDAEASVVPFLAVSVALSNDDQTLVAQENRGLAAQERGDYERPQYLSVFSVEMGNLQKAWTYPVEPDGSSVPLDWWSLSPTGERLAQELTTCAAR